MLCLRDPADETNDLGRKAIAIKHVQATFKQLCFNLNRDMAANVRASLLAPLVGTSYMLNKQRRERLRHYGYTLSKQLSISLAQKAKQVREDEQVKIESEEEAGKKRLASEERDKEWQRSTEERHEKLRLEAQRIAVLEHGDAMASVLGMPSVEDDASTDQYVDAEMKTQVKRNPTVYHPAEPMDSAAEKRLVNSALAQGTRQSEDAQR
jgi:non-canonical poly(A) RNA polymerase PAPD5/7